MTRCQPHFHKECTWVFSDSDGAPPAVLAKKMVKVESGPQAKMTLARRICFRCENLHYFEPR
jgi:hypothetical protein